MAERCEICGAELSADEKKYCLDELCHRCCEAEHLRLCISCVFSAQCPYHCEQ